MNSNFLTHTIRLTLLLLAQVLVFSHIHLFGYVTPLVIGYVMVCFRQGSSRVELLLWGFVTGLLFDMTNNTAGMASTACTLVAMVQPAVLNAFTPHDTSDGFMPSLRVLGAQNYLLYVLFLMFILHGVFYLLDAFTLANWPLTMLSIAGSTLLATVLCFFIELMVHPKR